MSVKHYDDKGNLIGRTYEDGTHYDEKGNFLGRTYEDGRHYDEKGNLIGTTYKDGRHYDEKGNLIGTNYEDGRHYGNRQNNTGRTENGKTKDRGSSGDVGGSDLSFLAVALGGLFIVALGVICWKMLLTETPFSEMLPILILELIVFVLVMLFTPRKSSLIGATGAGAIILTIGFFVWQFVMNKSLLIGIDKIVVTLLGGLIFGCPPGFLAGLLKKITNKGKVH